MNLIFLYIPYFYNKYSINLLLTFHIILNLILFYILIPILIFLIFSFFLILSPNNSKSVFHYPITSKKMFHYIQKSSISQLNSTFLHINPFFLFLSLEYTQKFPFKNQRTEGKSVGSINRTRNVFPCNDRKHGIYWPRSAFR